MPSSHGKSVIGGITTQHLKTGLKVLMIKTFQKQQMQIKAQEVA
jgi:hypothetical protein